MIQQIPAISQSHQYLVTSRVHARSPDVTGGVPTSRRTACSLIASSTESTSPTATVTEFKVHERPVRLGEAASPGVGDRGAVGHNPLVHLARAHEGEVAARPVVPPTCRTPGRCNGRTRPAQPTSAPSERMRRWPPRSSRFHGRARSARGRLQSNPHGATPQRCSRTRERWGRPASILRSRQARATRGPVRRPGPSRQDAGEGVGTSRGIRSGGRNFRGRPAAPRTN